MGTCVVTVLMVLVMLTKSELITNDEECDLLQYLTIGRYGTIQCSFSEYHAVSWFNIEEDKALLFYEKGATPEDGDAKNDYDIYPNGSLFIRNVTLEHETMFRVTKVISVSKPTVSYEIRVQTIVPPLVPHPAIDQCQHNISICYVIQEDISALSCFVQNVRPRISLVWNQREADRDKPLTSELTIESRNNETFTSRSTVQISTKFPILAVLVCIAGENAWLLEESETVVVLEKESRGRISETRKQFIELHTKMLLPCITSDVPVIVWKRMVDTENTEEVILLKVNTWKTDFIETHHKDFRLNSDGSLLLRNTEWHHQGRYTCLVAEYTPEELHIDVVIFVMPVPRYLKVAGCDFQRYCVLKVNQGDMLTCSVHGIRPEVNLEWRVYEPNTKVSFLQENHRVHPNSDNYDITLKSTITFTPTTEKRVTVECRVVGRNADIFNLSQTIDLLIPNVQTNSNNTRVSTAVITVAIIVIVIVILVMGGIIIRKAIHANDSHERGNLEEALPMISPTAAETNKLDQLITELKGKYELLYDAVQPIPYIRHRMFCVDKVFVEGGIEYLEKTSGTTSNDIWKPLASYRHLFDMAGDKSKRHILEGEPGYGKSTLTLQLAYDWCNNISNSPVSKIKVLVFLRLRQLGGVQSIYKAISRFILAKDSKITEDDVKSLLNESGSVLVILDGYDEYPDQDNMDTDVSLIIKKEILRDIDVILTTRSSYLPNHRVPQTSRVRLRGFDETARDQYIRKAVVGDDNEDKVEKIKLKLKQNPVLRDLCEVPLFFVMFAHMTHESEDLETFHSVTGFFRYMISCFHSHLRNKMRDENVQMSEAHENDHSMLDEVAFEALSGYSKKILWKKEQLRKLFGEEFYNQYIRVGILVEDDVLDCDDRRDAEFHAEYIVEVRFYHKLFCEWYAAHYLARNVSKLSSNADQLLGNLDPYDLQYVYRFACGLNKDASEHILKYLQRTDEGQKFAILCILEQEDNMQNFVEVVTKLVSKNVEINFYDSRLLQRSTLQILEFASKKEIPINCLNLNKSFKECEESNIVLHSGLTLTYQSTLESLQIEMEKDEETQEPKSLSEEEMKAIFKYVLRSRTIKKLSFESCLLPLTLSSDSVPAEMQSRDIKVFWNDYGYILNLQSGVWKVDDVDTVKRICTENVNIFRDDSELLQKCTIQLLENASYYDIPITCLHLNEPSMECEESNIALHSGLTLNYLSTLESLQIEMEKDEETQEARSLSEEEMKTIFQYMLRFKALMKLSFDGCLLPLTLSSESTPAEMQSRDIKLFWNDYGYILNLQSGVWEVADIDTVKRVCTKSVNIFRHDSELLQRCTIKLLENASYHDIPISSLNLNESLSKIDAGDVILLSGLHMSCPSTVKKVVIHTEEGRKMKETEVVDIMMFVQQSHLLEKLEFDGCLLPTISSSKILAEFKTTDIKVLWMSCGYSLNFQSGAWEVDVDTVTRICKKKVSIYSNDSDSKQRCTIKLLENASAHDIPISCLHLGGSFSKIDAGDVILHSGLRLSCPVSVKKVVIRTERGREMTQTEVINMLTFVKQPHMLEELEFTWCVLPQSIPAEYIPSILNTRNVKVTWIYAPMNDGSYTLNLQSGRWMDINSDRS